MIDIERGVGVQQRAVPACAVRPIADLGQFGIVLPPQVHAMLRDVSPDRAAMAPKPQV